MPAKKYVVRLTDNERSTLKLIIKSLSGSSQKVRRTVENVRRTLVEEGFTLALNGKKRESPPRAKLLDGEQEAKIIATRLGQPPTGYANWSLRLLTDKVVELGIIDSVSKETVRRTLKKTI